MGECNRGVRCVEGSSWLFRTCLVLTMPSFPRQLSWTAEKFRARTTNPTTPNVSQTIQANSNQREDDRERGGCLLCRGNGRTK
jgi:hypothetical protein